MTCPQRPALRLAALCFFVSLFSSATALGQAPAKQAPAGVPVTVSASGTLVRFAALGPVERMRLEVFDPSGAAVFDTGLKPGNVRDWRLAGAHDKRLPDATYLCVVTVREVSGRLSF